MFSGALAAIIALNKPVIIITGAPKSGKTTAAFFLSRQLQGYVYVAPASLDNVAIMDQIQNSSCKGIILEGSDLTVGQLKEWGAIKGSKIGVININAGDTRTEELVELHRRASSSWICPNCGREYNSYMDQLPDNSGICDDCQAQLIRKPQDQDPRVFKKSLAGYYESSAAVLEYLSQKEELVNVFYHGDTALLLEDIQDMAEVLLARLNFFLRLKILARNIFSKKTRPQAQPKTFGYFDNENSEYVITDPNTPAPWINYLGIEKFFALISHRGGGFSFPAD